MRFKKKKIFAMILCFMLVLTGLNLNGLCIANIKANTEGENPLPNGFITNIQLGYLDTSDSNNFVAYGENDANTIDKNGEVALGFSYNIDKDNNLETNKEYSFTLDTGRAITLKDSGNYQIIDNGTTIAEFTTTSQDDGSIKVALTFTDDASNYLKDGSSGFFYFSAYFNGDSIGNTGKQDITITPSIEGSETYTIPVSFEVTPVTANLSVSKSADTNKIIVENNKIYIPWTITATTSLSGYNEDENYLDSFVITDTLLDGLKVDKDKTTEANQANTNINISYDSNDDGNVTAVNFTVNAEDNKIALSEVDANNEVQVTVWTESELNSAAGSQSWYNKASAEITYPDYVADENGKATSTTSNKTAETAASCTFNGVELSKNNGEIQDDGTIKWTITTANKIGALQPYLSDTLPEGLTLKVDDTHPITITTGETTESLSSATGDTYSEDTYKYDETNRILRINLNSSSEEQTITYYTTYAAGTTKIDVTLVNKVVFGYNDGTSDIILNDTATSGSVTPGSVYIQKDGKYTASTQTIDWTVTIKNDGLDMDSLIIADVYNSDENQNNEIKKLQNLVDGSFGIELYDDNGNTIYSISESKVNEGSIVWNIMNSNVNGTSSAIGTITLTPDSDATGFTIKFEEESIFNDYLNLIKTVKITYKTQLSKDYIDEWINKGISVNNKVTISDDVMPALSNTGTVWANTPVLSKNFVSYDYDTHTAEWKVTVNEANMALTNPTVSDVINNTIGQDEYGLDWQYVDGSLVIEQGSTTLSPASSKGNLERGYYYLDTDTMTVYLPTVAADDAKFEITYKTAITNADSLKKLADNNTINVKNTATLTGDPINNTNPPTATAEFNISGGQLSKTGSDIDTSSHEITWTIDVNKKNAIIDGDGAQVAVCDELQSGLLYLEDTLKVYKLAGTNTDGWNSTWTETELASNAYSASYDEVTRKLTITFNDDSSSMKNCITKAYRIKFNTRVLVSGNYGNSAYFAKDKDNDENHISVNNVNGNFGGGYTSLKVPGAALLLLHGADIEDKVVNGGQFELYKVGESGTSALMTDLTTATTEEGTWLTLDGTDYNGYASGLPYGNYRLVMNGIVDGYSYAAPMTYEFTLSSEEPYTVNILYLNENDKAKMADVTFSKEASDTGNELSGAIIKIERTNLTENDIAGDTAFSAVAQSENSGGTDFNNDGTKITWTSTDTPAKLGLLPEGEYTMTELTAPDGYTLAAAIDFKIAAGNVYLKDESGNYTVTPSTDNTIVMVDEKESTVDDTNAEPSPAETDPDDSSIGENSLNEDTHGGSTAEAEDVATKDHPYRLLLLCASLMLLSVAVTAAACRRQKKDLTE